MYSEKMKIVIYVMVRKEFISLSNTGNENTRQERSLYARIHFLFHQKY